MTHQTETARELLHRHGLPEDIIDGALCLHAQELAAQQRKAHDELRPYSHMGLPCKPEYECGARRVIDLIDPTRTSDAHPCNAATMYRLGNLATAHGPHPWEPQPGMEPVHCPGTRKPPMDPVHILGIWADDEPADGARQDGTQP